MKTPTHHPTDAILEHTLLAGVPRWSDGSPELRALAEDIEARGIDQPLIVTTTDADGTKQAGTYFLLDGRHRLAAARQAGLAKVPVVLRDDADPAGIVLGTLTQRRHFNKGALAYLCFPVLEATAAAHGGNRRSKSTESTLIGVEDIATRCGFGRDLYFQAKKAHEIFRRRPDLREHFEPLILTGQVGLGAAIAGCAGQEATKGQGRQVQPPEQLLFAAFEAVTVRFRSWDKLEGTARREVADRAIETVLALPPEVQESIGRALRASRRAA